MQHKFTRTKLISIMKTLCIAGQDAVLSQGGPRDAAMNFDTYRISQRHRAVSLQQHGFLVGLCLQTAVNYSSKSDKY